MRRVGGHARQSPPWAGLGYRRTLSPAPVHRAAISSQLSSAASFFVLLSWLPTFFQETFPGSKVGEPCRHSQGQGAPQTSAGTRGRLRHAGSWPRDVHRQAYGRRLGLAGWLPAATALAPGMDPERCPYSSAAVLWMVISEGGPAGVRTWAGLSPAGSLVYTSPAVQPRSPSGDQDPQGGPYLQLSGSRCGEP